MDRRQFLKVAGAAVGAPYVMKFGREARAQTLRVRRNLSQLGPNDPFFTQYAEAIRAMHALAGTDRRSWRGQAVIHADFCPHGSDTRPDFILWHRHYITFFERLCGSLIGNSNFALPYWDWTANNGRLPAPFFGNGPLNVAVLNDRSDYQANNWGPDRIATKPTRALTAARGLRDHPALGGEFTPQAINGILRLTGFATFQGRIEVSPHNNGHVISGGVDGHMGDGLSPLDPMFWLHHCNVDRMTAQWQRAGNRIPQPDFTYNGQFVDPSGAPQTVTAAQALDVASMGFTYDILAEAVVASREAPAPRERSALQERSIKEQASVIGRGENARASTINQTTQIRVSTQKIADKVGSSRSFRAPEPEAAPRVVTEQGRILARLAVAEVTGNVRQCLVNVFVNAPALSPDTPASDPHYAGSFSFFGQHVRHHGGTFLVDVSDALRAQAAEGRLNAADIDIQVLPLLLDPQADGKPQFVVKSVELVSV